MPSSSLILKSRTTLVLTLTSLLLPAYAASNDGFVYDLTVEYSGSSFFDNWDFFDDADPTHGFVTYVNRTTALADNLIGIDNGDAVMRVDTTNTYDPNSAYYGNNGYGRPSVRITTQQAFDHGLFIADIKHSPGGLCGTWPAFWTLGADNNWPYSGEIDIVEGVNNQQMSTASMHTGGKCSILGDSRTMTGTLQSNNCQYDVSTGANAAGCAITDTDTETYGPGLNGNGGAVIAMEWTSDAVKMWSFERQNVPSDIGAGTPDPSSWGLPRQIFNGPDCNIDSVIGPQNIIINTDFCGDYGDAVWSSEGCAAQTTYNTCADYVANNPSAFVDAYWQFGYVRYFQRVSAPVTSTTTSTSASLIPTTSQASTTVYATSTMWSNTSSAMVSPTLISTISIVSSTNTNEVSPTIISTSSIPLTALTSAIPQGSNLPVPMGSAVQTNAGWEAIPSSGNWRTWPAATTSEPMISTGSWNGWINTAAETQPIMPVSTWAGWSNPATTTTIMTTWVEPCETGYTTKTTYLVTVHCGCTETPVPTIPMQVVTTVCPESWGFETPVVFTIPAPSMPTPAQSWPVWSTGPGPVAQTWQTWTPESNTYLANSNVWPTWSTSSPVPSTTSMGWLPLGSSTISASLPVWSFVTQTAVPVPSATQWNTWSVSYPVGPTPTSSQVWSSLNGNSNPYIAEYTGTAAKTSVGMGLIGVAMAVAAIML